MRGSLKPDSSSLTTAPNMFQVEGSIPLENGQRPLNR